MYFRGVMTTKRRTARSASDPSSAVIEKLKQEYERRIEKNKQEYERRIENLERKLNKKESRIKTLEGEVGKKDRTIRRLSGKVSLLSSDNTALRKALKDSKKITDGLERSNKKMEVTIAEQNRRLDWYENAHVPSSKQGPFSGNGTGGGRSGSKSSSKKKGGGKNGTGKPRKTKRGGVRGHKGGTHIFNPTQTQRHTADACPHCDECCRCDGKDIRDLGRDEKRRMVSIPEFIPHTVTQHLTARYACRCCKKEFEADNGLPANGQFDWPVIRYVTYQYDHRKTAEMISQDMSNFYRLDISSETVRGICANGGRYLRPLRDRFIEELKKSPATLMDETDYKGEPRRWIVGIRDADTVAYFQAPNRTARDLISQAKGCIGAITRDGYRGYDTVFPDNIKQRCTQHISREGKNISRRTDLRTAKKLYHELSEKFAGLRKWTRGRHSKKARMEYVTKLQEWLHGIIARYRRCHHRLLKKFGTTLENAGPEMFTFVIHPYIHSTTNLIEQSIQKVIGQRKSRRQLKSDAGAETLCILLSCFETWKLRKLNVWDELRKVLSPASAANI